MKGVQVVVLILLLVSLIVAGLEQAGQEQQLLPIAEQEGLDPMSLEDILNDVSQKEEPEQQKEADLKERISQFKQTTSEGSGTLPQGTELAELASVRSERDKMVDQVKD